MLTNKTSFSYALGREP